MKTLSEETRTRLISRGLEVRLELGELLFEKGDPGDAVYVVIEGEIEIGVTTEGGRSVRFAALKAGDVLGELAALDGGPRSADARAARRSKLLKIPRETLMSTIAAEPGAALALLSALAARVRHADAVIESHALLDLPAKVARFLLEESGQGGRVVGLTQTEMARRISISREKLNRKLHAWADAGLVELSRAGVKVTAPVELQKLVRRRDLE